MRKREEHEMNKLDSWMESYPKNWELTSVRGITENINQKNSDSKNTNYLSLMANVGVLLYADKGDVGNKLPDDLSKCKLVDIGDLVINSMNYGIGSYGISPYNGICSPVYLVLRSNKQVVLNEFAKRIFEIDKFQKHAQSFGTGILEHRRAINWDILKNIPVALPDLATQQRIAVFLDAETSKIDSLSDELTKFKANLLLQKRSLVSECVTKGIPSERDRAYKDSGLYWMGDIASNYEIVKLNNITSDKINDGPHTTPEFVDEGMPFLSVNNIQDHKLDFKNLRMVSKEAHGEYTKKAKPEKGDILLGKSASIGKTAIVDVDFEFSIWSPLALIKINSEKAYSKFVYYVFISDEMQEQIDLASSESTQKNIGMGKISALKIQIPPLDEQQRIADYLDVECARIDALIGEIDNQVNLLKTYRKSLINEVVTGKIEV